MLFSEKYVYSNIKKFQLEVKEFHGMLIYTIHISAVEFPIHGAVPCTGCSRVCPVSLKQAES